MAVAVAALRNAVLWFVRRFIAPGASWWPVAAGAVLALVVMRECSSLLSAIEVGGGSQGMAGLTAPHVGSLDDGVLQATELWSRADRPRLAASWIRWHVAMDALLFTPSYVAVLWRVLSRATAAVAVAGWTRPGVLALGVGAIDEVENVLTWLVSDDVHAGRPAGGVLATGLGAVTWAKWVSLVVVLVMAALRWLESRASVPRPRVLRRLRVQIGALAALGALIALPGGGPLEQVPDVLRTLTDEPGIRWGELLPPVVSLFALIASLWVAGRWALFDGVAGAVGPAPERRRGRPVWMLVAAAAILATLGAIARARWSITPAILALPVVLLVLAVVGALAGIGAGVGALTSTVTEDPTLDRAGAARSSIRRAARVLTVVPFTIAGVGLVRAFAPPVLVRTPDLSLATWVYLGAGVVTTLVAGPVAVQVLARLEWHVLGEPPDDDVLVVAPRSGRSSTVVALLLAVGLAFAIGRAGGFPMDDGPFWNVTGLLTMFLAAVVLPAGWLQQRVELRQPLRATYALRLGRRTPVFLLTAVVFVTAGLLDTEGGYHDVRITSATGAPVDPLDVMFRKWRRAMADCTPSTATRAVPLVLVAAPGGGIRAAYWTGSALDQLASAGSCGPSMVFAASGVSGGSVGLTVAYAGDRAAPHGQSRTEALSGEVALSAQFAAMLYRDLPAALGGVRDAWDDRAAVFERSWQSGDGDLTAPFRTALAPGLVGGAWRPLLLLNGTEVSSGCRVVVAATSAALAAPSNAPASCRGDGVVPGETGFVSAAVDASAFTARRTCVKNDPPGDLRASTAALLSARFPYVSPSGTMYRCDGARIADLDGGAAENSGLATLLDLWERMEPLVASYNRSAASGSTDAANPDGSRTTVVPLLVMLDNHYVSTKLPTVKQRARELWAPLEVADAETVRSASTTLAQEAMRAFGGSAAGTTDATVRVFRVSPARRPTVAAPLGWVLSDITRAELRGQLQASKDGVCGDVSTVVRPQPLGCLLETLAGMNR